jgi:hypothetical protein
LLAWHGSIWQQVGLGRLRPRVALSDLSFVAAAQDVPTGPTRC